MNLARASLLVFSGLLFLGCAVETGSDSSAEGDGTEVADDAISSGSSNFGYFIVTRHDLRKCVSPLCGGLFVKRVNQATTACADGTKQPECYVSSITFGGVGLSAREEADLRAQVESGKALVKAKMYKSTFNGTVLGTLKANEGWVGATGSTPDGTFFRVADNGLRCITAPCPSTTAAALNGDPTGDHNVIDVKLDDTEIPADPDALDRASQAIGTREGILIAGGIALPKCKPDTNCGPFASATELYLRVTRREGKACGGRGGATCNADQYCNWKESDICGAADASGRCTYKPEMCIDLYKPVCGCDGNTYSNSCQAAAAGFSVSSEGACAE